MPQSTEVWYRNGSVVLKAGDTLFKLYYENLVEKSTVFNDMLKSAARNRKHLAYHEGIPIVELTDDPRELVYFLKSINDQEYYQAEVLPSLERMLYAMKPATKYKVANLRSDMLKRIVTQSHATAHTRFTKTPDIMKPVALDSWILMVNIARQCEAPILLPRALTVFCSHLQPYSLVPNDATKEKLSLRDRALIADASHKLLKSLRETVHQPVYLPTQEDFLNCLNVAKCRPAMEQAMKEMDPQILVWFLKNWVDWKGLRKSYPDVCESCIARYKTTYASGSKEIWKNLPSYFNLSPWEELKSSRGYE